MQKKISRSLYVGKVEDLEGLDRTEWAVVHANKNPGHANALGYTGSLSQDHPHYLYYEKEKDLYLNLVDMKMPFLPRFTDPIFKTSFRFIFDQRKENKVLICCNKGESRSPSIGLAYMAAAGELSNYKTYEGAVEEFKEKHYPDYNPGNGISSYLRDNWQNILKF